MFVHCIGNFRQDIHIHFAIFSHSEVNPLPTHINVKHMHSSPEKNSAYKVCYPRAHYSYKCRLLWPLEPSRQTVALFAPGGVGTILLWTGKK